MRAKVQKVKSLSKKKGGEKRFFFICIYSRAQGEKVRKRISPIKELAGRSVGSSWLAQPYHRRMSSACMGKPSCSHSSRGEVEGLCAKNTSARWACFQWHGLWNCTPAWRTDGKSLECRGILNLSLSSKFRGFFLLLLFCFAEFVLSVAPSQCVKEGESKRVWLHTPQKACLREAEGAVGGKTWERERFNRIEKGINRKRVCNAPQCTITN